MPDASAGQHTAALVLTVGLLWATADIGAAGDPFALEEIPAFAATRFCDAHIGGSHGIRAPFHIDGRARKALEAATEFYAGLKSFSVEVTDASQFEALGKMKRMTFKSTVHVERPNRFAKGERNPVTQCDGEEIVTCSGLKEAPPDLNFLSYGIPADLEGVEGYPVRDWAAAESSPWLAAFLASDAPRPLFRSRLIAATRVGYAGVQRLGSLRCWVIRMEAKVRGRPLTVHLWIERSKTPWLRRVVTQETIVASVGSVSYRRYKANPVFPEGHFQIGETRRGGLKHEASIYRCPSPALLGQRAWPFTLPRGDGEEARLADHIGQDTVILLFGDLKCPGVVEAREGLSALAGRHKARGTVFYHILAAKGGPGRRLPDLPGLSQRARERLAEKQMQDRLQGVAVEAQWREHTLIETRDWMRDPCAVEHFYVHSNIQPYIVVIDRAGTVQAMGTFDTAYIEAAIRALLAGEKLHAPPPAGVMGLLAAPEPEAPAPFDPAPPEEDDATEPTP